MPKHGSNSLDNYIEVHERVLRIYSKFTKNPMVYKFIWVNPSQKTHLDLECHGIELTTNLGTQVGVSIEKGVLVDRTSAKKPQAKTIYYKYHAYDLQTGRGILRYCSPESSGTNHHAYHHCHRFPAGSCGQGGVITIVGADAWPHVGEFFNEVLMNF